MESITPQELAVLVNLLAMWGSAMLFMVCYPGNTPTWKDMATVQFWFIVGNVISTFVN